MAFGDITLNSNIAQYYANPFAQYCAMPFFMPFANQYNFGYAPYYQQYNFGYNTTPYYQQYPNFFFGNQNFSYNNNNYSNYYNANRYQNVVDYSSPNFWEDMGLDLSSNKSKTAGRTAVSDDDDDGQGSLVLSNAELAKMGFNDANLRERWKHLTPRFQRALVKLTKYAEKHGIKISYGKRSTWRSHQDQIDLKRERGHYAAKPGSSPHEKGIAVDITTTSVNGNKRSNRENQALLGAYWESLGYRWGGHFQNFDKEPWHFDLKPTRS